MIIYNDIKPKDIPQPEEMEYGAVYGRMSTDMQKEESIEAQYEAVYRFAESRGITIIEEYADRGISGTSTNKREEFHRMIEDAKRGKFKYILVHKVDRFARNLYDYITIEKELQQYGIEVIATNSPFDNTPAGRAMKVMLVTFAELFSGNLAEEVKIKMTYQASQGILVTRPPMAFRKVGNNFEINEEEAETIRFIFDSFIAGKNQAEIAREVLENKMPPHNRLWDRQIINRVLHNESYVGNYCFNKSTDGEFVRVEGRLPKVVSVETWNKVQIMLKEKRAMSKPKKGWHKYLLVGKLFCSCGQPLNGTSTVIKGVTYRYYRSVNCSCPKYNIRTEMFDGKVLNAAASFISSLDIEELSNGILKELDKDSSNNARRLKLLTAEEKELNEEGEMLMKLYYSKQLSAERLSKEDMRINARLSEVREAIHVIKHSKPAISQADIVNYINDTLSNIEEADEDLKQSLLLATIDRIVKVDDDTYEIHLYAYKDFSSSILYVDSKGNANDTIYKKGNDIIAVKKIGLRR